MSWCLRKLHENGLTTLQVMKFPSVILMKMNICFTGIHFPINT